MTRMLEGNPGGRPLNGAEPQPRRALPRCPEHLDAAAKLRWRSLSKELYDAGLLTAVDRDALAAYCMAYSRWVGAEAVLQQSGPVIKTKSGNLIQNPYLSVANRAMEQMAKIGVEFGMTPSSRSRIHVDKPDDGMTLADELFAGVLAMERSE